MEPLFDYPTSGSAVTGGFVVRDPALTGLVGRYLYGDYFDGDIRSLALNLADPCGAASTPPTADTTAPTIRTRVPRRQRVLRLRGAVAYVRCNEVCAVSASGTLRIGKRKLSLRRASAAAQLTQRKRLKVRLTKRSARLLRRRLAHGGRPVVQIRLRARDAAGNRSRLVRRSLRVRR